MLVDPLACLHTCILVCCHDISAKKTRRWWWVWHKIQKLARELHARSRPANASSISVISCSSCLLKITCTKEERGDPREWKRTIDSLAQTLKGINNSNVQFNYRKKNDKQTQTDDRGERKGRGGKDKTNKQKKDQTIRGFHDRAQSFFLHRSFFCEILPCLCCGRIPTFCSYQFCATKGDMQMMFCLVCVLNRGRKRKVKKERGGKGSEGIDDWILIHLALICTFFGGFLRTCGTTTAEHQEDHHHKKRENRKVKRSQQQVPAEWMNDPFISWTSFGPNNGPHWFLYPSFLHSIAFILLLPKRYQKYSSYFLSLRFSCSSYDIAVLSRERTMQWQAEK